VLLAAAILLGMLSGFIIRRLGSGRPLRPRERKVLTALGWMLVALWLTLAVVLLLWAAAAFARL
jgi:hypothetical protein